MSGLTQELVVSRSVRDTAAVLEWVSDPPPGDPYTAPARERAYTEEVGADPGRLRIGLTTTPPGGQFQAHPDCVAAAEAARPLLETLGHDVEGAYPDVLDDERYVPSFLVRWSAGVDWNLRHWSEKTGREIGPGDVEALTWALAEMGRGHTAGEYLAAVEYHQLVSRKAADWWAGGYDLLLTPTMAVPPLPLGSFPGPREPADADRDRHAVRDLHRRVQHHRASPPSRCRSPRASRGCRSGCSWWPGTGARTCSSAWRGPAGGGGPGLERPRAGRSSRPAPPAGTAART